MATPVESRPAVGSTSVVPEAPKATVGVNDVVAEMKPVRAIPVVGPKLAIEQSVGAPIVGAGPVPAAQERTLIPGKGI